MGDDDAMSNPLVSASDLARSLGDVTVLDVRYRMGGPGGPEEYAAGHIPGAAYVDLDTALAGPPGPLGRHPLPETDVFQEAMRVAGVDDGRPVVVYDDWEGRAAARCWWLLRFQGHIDVRVLDGGWSTWVREVGEVETGAAVPRPGSFTAESGHLPVLEVDDVLEFAARHTLIDARAPERFRGEVEPVDPVAGHIPGAVNLPTTRNLGEDGTFLDPEELLAVYREVFRGEDDDVAAYCGSGVTAAHDVLALAVAGIPAALYPGSWSEWVADASRPVETG